MKKRCRLYPHFIETESNNPSEVPDPRADHIKPNQVSKVHSMLIETTISDTTVIGFGGKINIFKFGTIWRTAGCHKSQDGVIRECTFRILYEGIQALVQIALRKINCF